MSRRTGSRVRITPNPDNAKQDFYIHESVALEMLKNGELGRDGPNLPYYPRTREALYKARANAIMRGR